MPGATLLGLSLSINPNALFVLEGTQMQMAGSATVRHWSANCTHSDQNAPIEWSLLLQPVGQNQTVDISYELVRPRSSPSNQFTPGLYGTYEVVLVCPVVAAATSARVFAGRGAVLEGTATAWVSNPFLGCKKFDHDGAGNPIRFHAVFVMPPNSTQATVLFDPITLPNAVITQSSPGTGSLDVATGTVVAHLQAAVQSRFSGTVTITLSSQAAIVACDESAAAGRALSSGTVVLVGDAPIDGPPGTTHTWLVVDANVTLVGFS